MMPGGGVMPSKPAGEKSDRLSEFQPVTPTAMKSTSTASLISTITVLTLADSLAPRSSSSVHSQISARRAR